MSTQVFKDLIRAATACKEPEAYKHNSTIEALRAVINDSDSKKYNDLSDVIPADIGSLDLEQYPTVIYSFNYIEFNSVDKVYIVIMPLSKTEHLYIKLVINNIDNSITRYRLAYVAYTDKLTLHHDLERMSYSEIESYLLTMGVEL